MEDFESDLPETSVDRLQMEQVLVNLIRNAYEALTSSKVANPTICLHTRRTGQAIEVCVEDNGPGLSKADLETIFQPFRTTKTEGLGLGLAICRSIVEEHDGESGRIRSARCKSQVHDPNLDHGLLRYC